MNRLPMVALFTLCLTGTASAADVLTLDDGRTVEGEYIGGGRASISFLVGDRVERFARERVSSLRFDPHHPSRSPAPAEPLVNARIVATGAGAQALQIQPMAPPAGGAN